MEFCIFVFNWPLPDCHYIYKEHKRSLKYLDVVELLEQLEMLPFAKACRKMMKFMSVSSDPTSNPDPSLTTIVRHTIPKAIQTEEPHFEVTLYYLSVSCDVIEKQKSKEICKPCSSAFFSAKRAARKKSKASATPAKPKASLSACRQEKLRATVISTQLQVKDLEDRLQELQLKIEKQGIGISESIEKDILMIMSGQNLDATSHMKFFWQEQMKLLQRTQMGRRYHLQIIRFALTLHGTSPSAYRELQESVTLILPSERVLRDYKNYFKPKAGISKENVEKLVCENLIPYSCPEIYSSCNG